MIFYIDMWNKHFKKVKRTVNPYIVIASLIFLTQCLLIINYSVKLDISGFILFLFVIPIFYLVIAWLNRICYWESDRYLTTILGRKGTLGYLKGKINNSTKQDWHIMAFWYLLFKPKAWCRFVRIRDLKHKDWR